MKNIILSFDYEIYFDSSNRYSPLLDNTREILRISSEYNTRLVFFIDIYYLIKLEEFGLTDVFNQIRNQIQDVLRNGHEIQYHYHPHWINAEYRKENDTWHFDNTEYSLSDIIRKYGKEFAFDSFNKGILKMKKLFNYSPMAYRSGGLSIDRNQEDLIQLLLDNKFQFDSSVMPGLYLNGKYISIDHTSAPESATWKIDSKSGFMNKSAGSNSCLREIPVMSLKKQDIKALDRFLTSVKYRIAGKVGGNSYSAVSEETGKPFDLGISESVYPISITFDKSNIRDIILLKFFTKEFFRNKGDLMCILSHPKSFLKESFVVMKNYFEWVSEKSGEYRFCVFNELSSD